MRLVSGLLRLVGISFLYGFISTALIAQITDRRRRERRKRLSGDLGFALAVYAQREVLRMVPRTGWLQLFLPRDTESAQDHVDDCRGITIEVAPELRLTLQQLNDCSQMFDVHETDEAARKKDKPLIPTSSMPRSKAERIEHLRSVWVPPDREAELVRLAESYESARDLIERWVAENVPGELQPLWLQLVEDFHLVRGKVAETCFEIHALQQARMAVYVAFEDPKRFPPEAAEAWIRRAKKLITKQPLIIRVDFFAETLARFAKEDIPTSLVLPAAAS